MRNRTELWTIDGSVNNTKVKTIANCIKARYDAGISNLQSDGNCKGIGNFGDDGVLEW